MFRGIANWLSGFDVAVRRDRGWWEKASDGAPTSPPPPQVGGGSEIATHET